MKYMVNADNVLRKGYKRKRLGAILVAFAVIMFVEICSLYIYISYINVPLTYDYEIFIMNYIVSLMSFIGGSVNLLPLSINSLKQCFLIFGSLWYVNIIIAVLLLTSLKRFSKFKGVEHGSASWGTDKELLPYRNSINTIPLAEGIYLDAKNNTLKNIHEIVIGDTGAGKTFVKLIADGLQFTGNYVFSDVKGTLFRQLYKVFKQQGYEVKVLNLKEIMFTNTFNPLAYINSDDDITEIVEIIKINSRDDNGKSGEQFWEDTMCMLLSSIITYLVQAENEQKTMSRVVDLISDLKIVNGKMLATCEYERIMNRLEIKDKFNSAVLSYKQFKQAPEETLLSVLISTTSRLRLWNNENVRIMTDTDELDIDNFMNKKSVIFLIVKPNNKTYKIISSMFLSIFFNRMFTIAETKYGGKLPCLLNVELDEFANLGKFNEFDTILTIARSYNIRIVPFIQSMQQLEKLYEKADDTIVSNCAIFNYLGTSDMKTRKNIVERLGKTTIEEKSISNNLGGKQGGGNESYRGVGRELLTIDELGRIDTSPKGNSIVFIDGKPFFCEKFKTNNHPFFKFIGNDIKGSEGYENNSHVDIVFKETYEKHKQDFEDVKRGYNVSTQSYVFDEKDEACGEESKPTDLMQNITREKFESNINNDKSLSLVDKLKNKSKN